MGVNAPGSTGTLYRLQSAIVSRLRVGQTMNCAPARIAARALSGSSTVPAPKSMSPAPRPPPKAATACRMTSSAPGVVNVTSMACTPPALTASAAASNWSDAWARMIAITPVRRMRANASSRDMVSLR
ncbi:MAG: hypothetical protein BWY52_00481 [Chloroflexi bacterium ADurb.Bin325]|nr:MAG: hypothetical protein BWY52_00481 [Chloroflexi bacterium ADurb.Bin325]